MHLYFAQLSIENIFGSPFNKEIESLVMNLSHYTSSRELFSKSERLIFFPTNEFTVVN